MKKKALFIDRDGTLIREPADEQIDSIEKFSFVPGCLTALADIVKASDYELIMVSNQDGLGTAAYPQEVFDTMQRLLLDTLDSVGVRFNDILIDRSFPEDGLPTRKPGTGMMGAYLTGDYDLPHSFMIGDRATDTEFARNMGCQALILSESLTWTDIRNRVLSSARCAEVRRTTRETDIDVWMGLDGTGLCEISTGLGFFDHMLEQIARHGNIDLRVKVKGDLQVDEHHTIEDTGLALGECILKAVGNKLGLQRYGFCLPMDDSLCQVAIDLGGRPWLVWEADFKRERIGEMPTEMFFHFFKSLSDTARMNLNIKAEGNNEHHKIEGIFKAFARALKMAVTRDLDNMQLPSSKGTL